MLSTWRSSTPRSISSLRLRSATAIRSNIRRKKTYWGNVNPIGPRSVYDEAKRFTEAVTMAYRRYHKVDTRIVRIFNTYGPRLQLNDGRVISNFMKQALRGEDLTVYGDGSQTRSFCYVSDEIDGFLRLCKVRRAFAGQHRQPERVHHSRMCQAVFKVTGSKSKIAHEPLPRTIPNNVVQISPKRALCLAGNRRFNWLKACACRWIISRRQSRKKP